MLFLNSNPWWKDRLSKLHQATKWSQYIHRGDIERSDCRKSWNFALMGVCQIFFVCNIGIRWLCARHLQPCVAGKTCGLELYKCDVFWGVEHVMGNVIAYGCADEVMEVQRSVIPHRRVTIVWEGHQCCSWPQSWYGRLGRVPCGSRYCLFVRTRTLLVSVAGTSAARQHYYQLLLFLQVFVCVNCLEWNVTFKWTLLFAVCDESQ